MIHGKQIQNASIVTEKLLINNDLDFGGFLLKNLGAPLLDGDAVNKLYVDAIAQGLSTKKSVILGTSSVSDLGTASYAAASDKWTSVPATPAFDGIALNDGDRILIKDATDTRGNGIWEYSSGASEFTRPENETLKGGAFVFITSGSSQADSGWVVSTPDGEVTFGTDNIEWSQFSSAGTLLAGTALSQSGSTLNVNFDNSTIGVVANALYVKDAGISAAKFANDVVGAGLYLDVNNAIAAKIDDETIGINTQNELYIPANSVAVDQLANIWGIGLDSDGMTVFVNLGDESLKFVSGKLAAALDEDSTKLIPGTGIISNTLIEEIGAGANSSGSAIQTPLSLSKTPTKASTILVFINGNKMKVGNDTANAPFYFKSTSGTLRTFASSTATIAETDVLWFNPVYAGFELETTDEINIVYSAV